MTLPSTSQKVVIARTTVTDLIGSNKTLAKVMP